MEKFVVVAVNSLLAAGLYATMSYGLALGLATPYSPRPQCDGYTIGEM